MGRRLARASRRVYQSDAAARLIRAALRLAPTRSGRARSRRLTNSLRAVVTLRTAWCRADLGRARGRRLRRAWHYFGIFGGARKVVCGKLVRAAVSRLGSRPVGARRPHASPGPRGDAPARVGVRDLVEVDLGECATVNAWVNGERLTLLLQLDGYRFDSALAGDRGLARVVGRLPFGLNSGSPIRTGCFALFRAGFCFWLSPIGRQNRVWAYRVRGGAGGAPPRGVRRRPGGGAGDPASRILCMHTISLTS